MSRCYYCAGTLHDAPRFIAFVPRPKPEPHIEVICYGEATSVRMAS